MLTFFDERVLWPVEGAKYRLVEINAQYFQKLRILYNINIILQSIFRVPG